ncbi:hypothetical protein DRN63_02495 [Nanoarchaeota archaeon]|nr:MAG: hypothetical protein DRN63_02495 [Nanoarchaeota archaeon]
MYALREYVETLSQLSATTGIMLPPFATFIAFILYHYGQLSNLFEFTYLLEIIVLVFSTPLILEIRREVKILIYAASCLTVSTIFAIFSIIVANTTHSITYFTASQVTYFTAFMLINLTAAKVRESSLKSLLHTICEDMDV